MKRTATWRRSASWVLFIVLVWLLAACAPPAPAAPAGIDAAAARKPRVVATTSILSDVVAQVGGNAIDLTALMALGVDPHSFEPTPRHVAALNDADLVFVIGFDLEEALTSILNSLRDGGKTIVAVSDGIEALEFGDDRAHDDEAHGHDDAHDDADHDEDMHDDDHDEDAHDDDHGHDHELDPHTWTDPNNVIVWVGNIQRALSAIDPANAQLYQANAAAYIAELQALDAWVRQQVEQIPPANRLIVTDHLIFGYFAQRYGFRQVGAVVPGYSTLAEPSARELAALEDAITDLGVKAIFVGDTVGPGLARRVAEDTGVELVFIYSGSLGPAGSPAATYLDYVRYNTLAFVDALK